MKKTRLISELRFKVRKEEDYILSRCAVVPNSPDDMQKNQSVR
jgi:hypothetical protein